MIREIVKEREVLVKELSALSIVQKVLPTDANFVLVRWKVQQQYIIF
jgi:histidinol-phosphate/aromatic aminotransferase/cobyric acid decarboxylase-like protein